MVVISIQEILQSILWKYYISDNSIKIYMIYDIIYLCKNLIDMYIIFYKHFLYNNIYFLINVEPALKNLILISNSVLKLPYFNYHKWKPGLISNFSVVRKNIALVKWLFYLLHYINKHKHIKIPFKLLIKIYKLFNKLKKKYWSMRLMPKNQLPLYNILLTSNFKDIEVIHKELKTAKKILICISPKVYYNDLFIMVIRGNPNIMLLKLLLELLVTAKLQAQLG